MNRSRIRILAATVLLGLLAAGVIVFSHLESWLSTPAKDRIGEACTPPHNALADVGLDLKLECLDVSSALMCAQDGHMAAIPCRGPKGCRSDTRGSFFDRTQTVETSCDLSLVEEGDPCVTPDTGRVAACGVDHRSELRCVSGHWKVFSDCLGPEGCASSAERIRCDASLATPGSRCQATRWQHANEKEWHDTYACSQDGAAMLICEKNTFRTAYACPSGEHCAVEGNRLGCRPAP